MAAPGIRDLIIAVNKLKREQATVPLFRKARVAVVNGGDNTVDLEVIKDNKPSYDTYPHVNRLASYSNPVVNDDVWFVSLGRGRHLCLGKQA